MIPVSCNSHARACSGRGRKCVTLICVEPVYLSAGMPRWTPQNETDLSAAAQRGLLEETHYLDVKREISAGRGANKELARDLASFAVDG